VKGTEEEQRESQDRGNQKKQRKEKKKKKKRKKLSGAGSRRENAEAKIHKGNAGKDHKGNPRAVQNCQAEPERETKGVVLTEWTRNCLQNDAESNTTRCTKGGTYFCGKLLCSAPACSVQPIKGLTFETWKVGWR
jgi:hypothetical protein